MITYDRVEKALARLAETDQPCADLKADVERSKYRAKAIHSAIFKMESGTVAERQAIADCANDYADAMEEYYQAISLYEGMRNERNHQELFIEVWRSVNSARNKGQIV